MCIPNSPRRYCLHLFLSLSLSSPFSPLSLAIRVDARKVKTSRNNGRLTSFFNGSCIDSWCTWFRVITRRLAYCAIVGVDLLEPRMGAWCRFDGACRDSPSVVDPLLSFSHLPSFLDRFFLKMFRFSSKICYRRHSLSSRYKLTRIDYHPI